MEDQSAVVGLLAVVEGELLERPTATAAFSNRDFVTTPANTLGGSLALKLRQCSTLPELDSVANEIKVCMILFVVL